MASEMTCNPDFEAMFHQKCEELEKAKYEIGRLQDENRDMHFRLEKYDAMVRTLEFVYGRKFWNGKAD